AGDQPAGRARIGSAQHGPRRRDRGRRSHDGGHRVRTGRANLRVEGPEGPHRGQHQQLHAVPGALPEARGADWEGQDLHHVVGQGQGRRPLRTPPALRVQRREPDENRVPAVETEGLGVHLLHRLRRAHGRRPRQEGLDRVEVPLPVPQDPRLLSRTQLRTAMAIRISPDIAGIVPYSPGKPIEEVERELGITGSIKLASNENPRGPSPKALAVLAEAAKTVNRYPDGGGYYLRDALAERWKVTPDQIILGNGSDEVITPLPKAGRNVVLLRTFSKIYGLAGLRIGYGLTTPEIVQHLNRIRPPFNTNSLAQKAALAALADEEHVRESRRLNTEGMAYLAERLRALGLTVVPSQANFLYFEVNQDGKAVFEALLRRGVIVRHLSGPFLRVTVGLPQENERFITALQTVLSK